MNVLRKNGFVGLMFNGGFIYNYKCEYTSLFDI